MYATECMCVCVCVCVLGVFSTCLAQMMALDTGG